MATWIIEPRDPLIVRDGRPFGNTPGVRAASLSFPFPSTTTGGLRTRAGLGEDGIFEKALINEVKNIAVLGPLLVELGDNDDELGWFVPAPSDALLLNATSNKSETAIIKRLLPIKFPDNSCTDLDQQLALIGMTDIDVGKPHSSAPKYWHWSHFEQWLITPESLNNQIKTIEEIGHDGPVMETRTHVNIDTKTQTSVEGHLFQTRGLEFTNGKRRLALAVVASANVKPGLASLGGERRMVLWREVKEPLPKCPEKLKEKIKQEQSCRLTLLTPALFNNGSQPKWLLQHAIQPVIKAIAIGRHQIVSGWDFEHQSPKRSRRLAPAGSTFFIKLSGDENTIDKWIDEIWMQNISDQLQDRNDGFGLAVLGSWSGTLAEMKGSL